MTKKPDRLLENSRPTKQERLDKVPVETKGYRGVPQVGDNVFRIGRLARVCSTRDCYEPVVVTKIYDNGEPEYCCPVHGKRNRQQMEFLDVTGSTMIQFKAPSKKNARRPETSKKLKELWAHEGNKETWLKGQAKGRLKREIDKRNGWTDGDARS